MLKWIVMFCTVFSAALNAETTVLAFAGSTREGSFNKKLVSEAARIATQMGAKVNVIDLKDYQMPFYNADIESKEGMPTKAKQLRQLMADSQVILIASPEYNASVSAVLKNTLDWASRNETSGPSRSAFKGKKFVIMSTSPGKGGGARGLVHLRAIIEDVGGTVLQQQIIVPNANSAFDEQGHLTNPQTKADIQKLIQQAIN